MSASVHLQALGLTEYESRAYTALLGLGQAAPARIARQASIPRPKIYETLERLEGRGLASKVQTAPIEYAPLSAREYLERSRREFDNRLELLEREMARITQEGAPEAVYPLQGEAAIHSVAQNMAENARKALSIAGHFYGTLEDHSPHSAQVIRAPLESLPPIAKAGQEPFLLARDGESALIAHFGGGVEAHGVHTHNIVIVKLVEGYIALAHRDRNLGAIPSEATPEAAMSEGQAENSR